MFEIAAVLVIIILIAGPLIIWGRMIGTPGKNKEMRTKIIEEKVISIER